MDRTDSPTPPFDHGWLYVGHEAEIEERGMFRRRTVAGRPVFLVRGADAVARVFFNTCTHRGALVCRQDQGQAKTFQCFYHAWTFNNEGELVGVPGEEAYGPGWNRDELGLKAPAQTESYQGFVFVNFDPGASQLVEHLGSAADELDRLDAGLPGGLRVVPGTQRFLVAAEWRSVVTEAVRGDQPAEDLATRVGGNLLLYPREAITVCRVEPRGEATELDVMLLLPAGADDEVAHRAVRRSVQSGPAGLPLLTRLEELEATHPTRR